MWFYFVSRSSLTATAWFSYGGSGFLLKRETTAFCLAKIFCGSRFKSFNVLSRVAKGRRGEFYVYVRLRERKGVSLECSNALLNLSGDILSYWKLFILYAWVYVSVGLYACLGWGWCVVETEADVRKVRFCIQSKCFFVGSVSFVWECGAKVKLNSIKIQIFLFCP